MSGECRGKLERFLDRVVNCKGGDIEALARALWRGLPLLWQEELRLFEAYEVAVGQEITEEGLRLWMDRVQTERCPVAGTGCDRPKRGRFCERHRALMPASAPPGL